MVMCAVVTGARTDVDENGAKSIESDDHEHEHEHEHEKRETGVYGLEPATSAVTGRRSNQLS
jgi:hypothetical protein